MFEFLDTLFKNIDPATAYFILFISAYIENVFPPIPGDAVTVIGAYLAATGKLGFWGVYLTTTFGSVLGFFSMYLIGLKFGRSFVNSKFISKIFNEKHIKKVELWFAKYGNMVIAANRFLSGTRSVISLFAGFFHLNWISVLSLSVLSALIWNGLLIYGGYLLGENWQSISGIISEYNKIVLALTVLAAALFLYRRWRRKKNK